MVLHSLDMSFDLIVLDSPQPLDARRAAEVYERTVDGEAEELRTDRGRTKAIVEALLARHTNLAAEAEEGESPFASTLPLDPRPDLVEVTMSWGRYAAVSADVVALALTHELTVYDPQAFITYAPVTLSGPSRATVESPWLLETVHAHQPLIGDLVARLAREARNPFCIVSIGDSFMQTINANNGDASRPLRIEHRLDDGEHMHLADPVEAETVTHALVSFAAGDDAWRRLPWEPLLL